MRNGRDKRRVKGVPREVELARIKEETSRKRRRRIVGWVASIGLLTTLATATLPNVITRIKDPIKAEQTVRISFEEALNNPNLRQTYLRQVADPLIKDVEQEFDAQGFIGRIVYDPNFEILEETSKKGLRKFAGDPKKEAYFRSTLRSIEEAREDREFGHLGQTFLPSTEACKRNPSDIHIGNLTFERAIVASEEDLKAIFDHELFHGVVYFRGMPIKKGLVNLNPKKDASMINPELISICDEVLAYHRELGLIEKGVRRVSSLFRQRTIATYNDFYLRLKAFTEVNNGSPEATFARGVLGSLEYHPGPRR
ncbi:MAG: hypothetical protein HYS32_04565 [Candidatus Woesearchaeota archaeon]|nr:MAG: hypothetical protein HYS32_04565 [Candidatus Woesearchaeota archaeon]